MVEAAGAGLRAVRAHNLAVLRHHGEQGGGLRGVGDAALETWILAAIVSCVQCSYYTRLSLTWSCSWICCDCDDQEYSQARLGSHSQGLEVRLRLARTGSEAGGRTEAGRRRSRLWERSSLVRRGNREKET